MIGQKKLNQWLDSFDGDAPDVLPHFIVLVGQKGSGKRTFAKLLAHEFTLTYSECGISVNDVRNVIDTAYSTHGDYILYCFVDADNMRNEAKNAMLKITEEPPKNAWFIMTVTNMGYLLDTIKSRAMVFQMEPYSRDELWNYMTKFTGKSLGVGTTNKLLNIAKCPGDINVLLNYGQEFFDYVSLVVTNIAEVESANAFKSGNKLALKNDEGYDLGLFFDTFIQTCADMIQVNPIKYAEGIITTVGFANTVHKLGVNKQQLYDNWVFSIREEWNE